jgi:hypothetical protein
MKECKNINCQSGVINGVNPKICKSCNPTFLCDGCGERKPTKEKFKVYDENYNLQRGLFYCAKCSGL